MPHFPVLASGGAGVCGTLTDGEVGLGPSSSRPVAVRPRSGVGSASAAWRVLSFTCAMPGGVFLAWLACWLLSWKFTFLFRAAGLYTGCLGFYASLLPGEVVFSEAGMAVRALLLATSLPLPMVFP